MKDNIQERDQNVFKRSESLQDNLLYTIILNVLIPVLVCFLSFDTNFCLYSDTIVLVFKTNLTFSIITTETNIYTQILVDRFFYS